MASANAQKNITWRPAILQLLPKLDVGGAERVAIEIAEALTRSGHRALIACEAGALTQAALRAGAEIFTLPLAGKSPLALRRNAGRLRRLIADQGVDLVHAHSRGPAWSGLWAARRAGLPFVTTWHGVYKENAPFKRRYNSVMAMGDRVVAVSRFIGEMIVARDPQAQARLRVIPGGVDPQRFDPATVLGDRVGRLAQQWRLKPGTPTILLPARLTGWKGQRLLITALAGLRHQDAIAVLAGGDQGRETYTRELTRLAQSLGVAARLRLAGNVEDMPAAMMLADVVVNASTDPEAFGRGIVEAQAMGRMVIAADHGGARETIADGETGLLFPPGDAGALAAAIDKLLDLPAELRIGWGRHIRAMVAQNYSVASMQAAMLTVYGELLGGREPEAAGPASARPLHATPP